MRLRIFYFSLGVAVSVVVAALLLFWDCRQEYLVKKKALETFGDLVNPPLYTKTADLEGRWRGKDDSNNPYTITRRSDGTYARTGRSLDRSKVVIENGHWAYSPPTYVEVDSRDGRLFASKIIPKSATEFQYRISEGAYMSETKE